MSEETAVDDGIRLVQVFLSPRLDGIWHVSLDVPKDRLICDCPAFRAQDKCKHARFVKARLDNNGGLYEVEVPLELAELVRTRPLTAEEYQFLVLHYGTPEVL